MRLKKTHVNGIRVIGIVGFAVIFLVFLTIPNVGNVNFFKSVDIVPQSAEDIVNEAKIIGQYSIVETDELFTESDDSVLQQFLDSSNIDSPLSTEKFGIMTDVALFDINNNKITESDVLGISQLVILDDKNNVLNLSTIQASFNGITKSPETSINISGVVKFYLDDDLIATKKIWVSDGSKQTLVPLYVVDNIPPSFSERKTNFTFTLSDEGKTWKTGTEHYYRIIISELTASLNSEKEQKKFNWSGEHIAYELKVYADETRIAKISDSNKVISVPKSDGTVSVTSPVVNYRYRTNGTILTLCANFVYEIEIKCASPMLPVSFSFYVKNTNEFIGMVDNSAFNQNVIRTGGCPNGGYNCVEDVTSTPYWKNPVLSNIPRDTELLIKTSDGKSFTYMTPLSQHNLYVSYDGVTGSSNFGWSK